MAWQQGELQQKFRVSGNRPDDYDLLATTRVAISEEQRALFGQQAEDGPIDKGRMALSAAAAQKLVLEAQRAKDKEADATMRFIALMTEIQEQLWQEIVELRQHIEATQLVIEGLTNETISLQDALSDKDVQKNIKEWEERTGKKFDKNDPDARTDLIFILQEQAVWNAKKLEQRVDEFENNADETRIAAKDAGINLDEHDDLREAIGAEQAEQRISETREFLMQIRETAKSEHTAIEFGGRVNAQIDVKTEFTEAVGRAESSGAVQKLKARLDRMDGFSEERFAKTIEKLGRRMKPEDIEAVMASDEIPERVKAIIGGEPGEDLANNLVAQPNSGVS